MEVLALVMIAPPMALVAAAIWWLLRRLKLYPDGPRPAVTFGITWIALVGGAFTGSQLSEMVVWPARFQAEHLGKQYGTLLNLRHYEASGFQDWVFKYRYRLTPEQVVELQERCKKHAASLRQDGCILYEAASEERASSIRLTGDVLTIMEWM